MLDVERKEDIQYYCPVCVTGFADDPDECHECGSPRREGGWRDISDCPYPHIGYVLNERYLLDRYLGGGASGQVYRAQDLELDRPFALKIVDMRGEMTPARRETLLRRFDNEVSALSRLRNPHVVNVYDSFFIGEFVPVLLMDYVEGVTLEEVLDQVGRMKLEQTLELVRQIANGLHEAHMQGVVHRDLKPANVMVEQMPASGFFARILDFGLVHRVEDVTTTSQDTEGFWGTPQYASPEQCLADGTVDTSSDIYALGCVLFHCLTGRPPFDSNDPMAVMEAHLDDEPPAPETLVPPGEVHPEVSDICMRMLNKNPEDRPCDLGDVIRRIDQLKANINTEAEKTKTGGSSVTDEESDPEDEAPPVPMLGTSMGLETSSTDASATETRTEEGGPGPRIVQLLATFDLRKARLEVEGQVTSAHLNTGGGCAVFSDSSHQVHLMSTGTDDYAASFEGAETMITAATATLHKGLVFGAEMRGAVRKWNIDRATQLSEVVESVDEGVLALAVDRPGFELFIGTESGRVRSHDLRTGGGEEIHRGGGPVSALEHGPGRRTLGLCYLDGYVEVLEKKGGKWESQRVGAVDAELTAVAFSPDGKMLAVIGREGGVRVFGLNAGDEIRMVEIETGKLPIDSVAFNRKGELLGLGTSSEAIRLWKIRCEHVRRDFEMDETIRRAN